MIFSISVKSVRKILKISLSSQVTLLEQFKNRSLILSFVIIATPVVVFEPWHIPASILDLVDQ